MTDRAPTPLTMTVDRDARWQEIQRMSDEIAHADRAPTPLESALCGAVYRARSLESANAALRARIEAMEVVLADEREKFQRETLRTSELSALLLRWIGTHAAAHEPGPWSRGCSICALVGESRTLLATPINAALKGTP